MTARPHLLLVDDEAAIREPLGAYLQRSGFRVSEAPNAAEARKILAGNAIELVILDIMMPGMTASPCAARSTSRASCR